MSDSAIRIRTQAIVLGVLVALTVVSVVFSFVEVSVHWHRGVALGIAAIQCSLIALFFMHGLTSPRVTWCVIAVAVFWLIAVLFVLTFHDYATRNSFPHVPGH